MTSQKGSIHIESAPKYCDIPEAGGKSFVPAQTSAVCFSHSVGIRSRKLGSTEQITIIVRVFLPIICFGSKTKGSPTQTVSWHPRHNRRKRPPPLILEEDALCSEHSGENLWQHQRVAERFSNPSANERRPSCTSVITAASLRGELILCAQLWNCCLWELVSYSQFKLTEDQVCQWWVTGLKRLSDDFFDLVKKQ